MMPTEQSNIEVYVNEQPIKGINRTNLSLDTLRAQAELGRQYLAAVNYSEVPGTCSDERARVGLLNGSAELHPRPSVLGGPDVYALAIAELTGTYGEDGTDGISRLRKSKLAINNAGVRSGGHIHCAANDGLKIWIQNIAEQPEGIKAYARQALGDQYVEDHADEIVSNARRTVDSGRYNAWTESILQDVLGDEAGEAIEVLADVAHEGFVFQRNKLPNRTVDQTAVYDHSVAGRGSFAFDDTYAETIEDAVVKHATNVEHTTILARTARECIIAAVAGVVPNGTLFQSNIR